MRSRGEAVEAGSVGEAAVGGVDREYAERGGKAPPRPTIMRTGVAGEDDDGEGDGDAEEGAGCPKPDGGRAEEAIVGRILRGGEDEDEEEEQEDEAPAPAPAAAGVRSAMDDRVARIGAGGSEDEVAGAGCGGDGGEGGGRGDGTPSS